MTIHQNGDEAPEEKVNSVSLRMFDLPPPDAEQARMFLSQLDPLSNRFVFFTVDDVKLPNKFGKEAKRGNSCLTRTLYGSFEEHAEELTRLNRLGAGVFVTMNEMSGAQRRAGEVTRIRAIWNDYDGGYAPDGSELLPPSVIVETSPGRRQVMWFIEGLSREEHTGVERRLAVVHGSDPQASDPARVLRLPGFHHMKGALSGHFHRVTIRQGSAPISHMLGEVCARLSREQVLRAFPPVARPAPSEHQIARSDVDPAVVRGALWHVREEGDPRDFWVNIGAALHHAFRGSSDGLELFHEWSGRGESYGGPDAVDRLWRSFKSDRVGEVVTLGTIYHLALKSGWQPPAGFFCPDAETMFDDMSELAAEIEAEAANAPPVSKGERLCWPAVNDKGKPYPKNLKNIRAVLQHLDVTLTRDIFAGKNQIKGFGLDGPLDDDAMSALWFEAMSLGLALHTSKAYFIDALFELARRNKRHPAREYFDGLRWDKAGRLGAHILKLLGSEDSPLNRAIVLLWMVAAVRRVRHPGTKFDGMLVLEGAQGVGKSLALKILAGDWFTDSLQLSASSKEIMEQTSGVLIVEFAELVGLANRGIEQVKALITRTEDCDRLACKRVATTVARQFVLVATTNDFQYLLDMSGNRRFLPLKVGKIDLDGLKRDRDQLWAEAAAKEKHFGPLVLPAELQAAAAEAQALREAPNPFAELLEEGVGDQIGFLPSATAQQMVGITGGRASQAELKAIAAVARKRGWTPVPKEQRPRVNGRLSSGYLVKWSGTPAKAPLVVPGGRAGPALVFDATDSDCAIDDLLA